MNTLQVISFIHMALDAISMLITPIFVSPTQPFPLKLTLTCLIQYMTQTKIVIYLFCAKTCLTQSLLHLIKWQHPSSFSSLKTWSYLSSSLFHSLQIRNTVTFKINLQLIHLSLLLLTICLYKPYISYLVYCNSFFPRLLFTVYFSPAVYSQHRNHSDSYKTQVRSSFFLLKTFILRVKAKAEMILMILAPLAVLLNPKLHL